MDRLLAQPLPSSWSADLQARFRVHRAGLLTCLDDSSSRPPITPANAVSASARWVPAERVSQVTGGFRSELAALGYAAIRTVSDTARKRGHNTLTIFLAAATLAPPPT